MKKTFFSFLFLQIILMSAFGQGKQEKMTDSNTPLHLMEPKYNVPYGVPDRSAVKAELDRILARVRAAAVCPDPPQALVMTSILHASVKGIEISLPSICA